MTNLLHLVFHSFVGVFDPSTNSFTRMLDDHFFLTDPNKFLYSHFPFTSEEENDYSRWQLLDCPIDLAQFNAKPHLSSMFFNFGLELVDPVPSTPWLIQDSSTMKIQSTQVIRYKVRVYKGDRELEEMKNPI